MIHSLSVQPLNDLASPAIARLLADAPVTPGKVRFAWRLAVGPAIDRISTASFSEDRRLAVSVPDESWRREIRRALPVIHERLAALLGPGVIETIVIKE